jgi:hypothetical protein
VVQAGPPELARPIHPAIGVATARLSSPIKSGMTLLIEGYQKIKYP